jgi:hypothetical protein
LAGPGENTLFDFGDRDGVVGTSRLQHPLGIDGGNEATIFVADTYNSKIKSLHLGSRVLTTIAGTGKGGFRDGAFEEAMFNEPGGIDFADGILYVADTNNHVIRRAHMDRRNVDTFSFSNPEVLVSEDSVTLINSAYTDLIDQPMQAVREGDGVLALRVELPGDYKLNPLVTSTYTASFAGLAERAIWADETGTIDSPNMEIPIRIPSEARSLEIALDIYYCEDTNESICVLDEVVYRLPLEITDSGATRIAINRVVPMPEVSAAPFGAFTPLR